MEPQSRNHQLVLAECEKAARVFLQPKIAAFIQQADAHLFDLADKARTPGQQMKLLEIVRTIKQKKPEIEKVFQSEFSLGFVLFRQGKLGNKPDAPKQSADEMFSSLSLVADDKLEVELAQSSFARRVETRYTQELFGLNQRLSILAGGRKIIEDASPVSPAQIAACLQKGIALLEVDTKLTTLLYRLLEKELAPELGKLYSELNHLFIGAGILPNLRPQRAPQTTGQQQAITPSGIPEQMPPVTTTQPQPHYSPAAQGGAPMMSPSGYMPQQPYPNNAMFVPHVPRQVAAAIAPPSATLPSPEYQQQLYGAIQSMQQHVARPAQWRTGSYGEASPQELLTVVHQAQERIAVHADRLDQDRVMPCETVDRLGAVSYKLQQEVARQTGKNINDDKASTIDLVGMIFEALLGESSLPDNVKAVLSYLHTPYMKIAFLDPGFFASPEHPARQLLNALEETGTKWVNADGSSQFKAYPKIKSIVRTILLEFNDDLALIEQLRDDIREFNQKTQNNVRLLEQREAQKAEGEDRIRLIKKRVYQTVKERIDGKKLPSPLIVLLLHPWSEYLTFVLLRHGDQSEEWKEALETINEATWSIQPKSTPEDKKRQLAIQDKLTATLQAGFDTIAYDQAKAQRLLSAIHEMQIIALQNKQAQPAAAEVRKEIEATAVGHEEARQLDVQPQTPAEHELVEKLRMVEFGTWMDFDELNGQTQVRAKIAWFNPKTLQYMLVNRSGKQIALMSALELARHMLSRNGRIINGIAKPFFERALENIFERMKTEVA